jgi:hypothetical protein
LVLEYNIWQPCARIRILSILVYVWSTLRCTYGMELLVSSIHIMKTFV